MKQLYQLLINMNNNYFVSPEKVLSTSSLQDGQDDDKEPVKGKKREKYNKKKKSTVLFPTTHCKCFSLATF